jgi:hypothetical protein
MAQMFDESTSTQRVKQDMSLYQELGLLAEAAVVRIGSFHAKFLLVDPTTPNRKGWLTSANLVSAACDQNVEFVAPLNSREIKLLYQVTRHAFWHEATTEVMADGSLKSVPCPVAYPLPSKDEERCGQGVAHAGWLHLATESPVARQSGEEGPRGRGRPYLRPRDQRS